MSDEIIKDRADWLLDAVACATQNRQFLRGEPEYDEVAGDAIMMNGSASMKHLATHYKARIEALEAQLKAAQDRDIAGLQQVTAMAKAMDDMLASPQGVVPASAERFYDSVSGRFFGLSVKPDRSRI